MDAPGGRRRERDGSDAVDAEDDVGLVDDESVCMVATVCALDTLHNVESATE